MYRARHWGNAVLAEKNGLDPSRCKEVQEISHDRIDPTQIIGHRRMLRAQPLKVVIEVRQIDEVQRRRVLLLNPLGRPGDPASGRIRSTLRRLHAGSGPPEGCERKVAQGLLQGRAQIVGPSVDIEELASIGRVHRPGRHRPVRARVHVVPPEHLRAGETRVPGLQLIPDLGGLD